MIAVGGEDCDICLLLLKPSSILIYTRLLFLISRAVSSLFLIVDVNDVRMPFPSSFLGGNLRVVLSFFAIIKNIFLSSTPTCAQLCFLLKRNLLDSDSSCNILTQSLQDERDCASIHVLNNLQGHISSVRALTSSQSSCQQQSKLLFSGGARASLKVWLVPGLSLCT